MGQPIDMGSEEQGRGARLPGIEHGPSLPSGALLQRMLPLPTDLALRDTSPCYSLRNPQGVRVWVFITGPGNLNMGPRKQPRPIGRTHLVFNLFFVLLFST